MKTRALKCLDKPSTGTLHSGKWLAKRTLNMPYLKHGNQWERKGNVISKAPHGSVFEAL